MQDSNSESTSRLQKLEELKIAFELLIRGPVEEPTNLTSLMGQQRFQLQ